MAKKTVADTPVPPPPAPRGYNDVDMRAESIALACQAAYEIHAMGVALTEWADRSWDGTDALEFSMLARGWGLRLIKLFPPLAIVTECDDLNEETLKVAREAVYGPYLPAGRSKA